MLLRCGSAGALPLPSLGVSSLNWAARNERPFFYPAFLLGGRAVSKCATCVRLRRLWTDLPPAFGPATTRHRPRGLAGRDGAKSLCTHFFNTLTRPINAPMTPIPPLHKRDSIFKRRSH